jgi:photosystem II stability/assembly factor-like uncharacterized protein
MKSFFKIALLLGTLFLSKSYAQPWLENIEPGKENNFFAIRDAFYKWTEAQESNKAHLIKSDSKEERHEGSGKYSEIFKRWEWFWETRVDSLGNFPTTSDYLNSYNHVGLQQFTKLNISVPEPNWQLIGPFQDIPGSGGGMGRVSCISHKPGNPNEVWIGTPAGGLWKSFDGGNTWQNTTTDNLPVIGISDIVFNHQNTNTVYIATGDYTAGDTYSVGILKSTNGGQSWNPTGMTFNLSINRRIDKLVMHPTDTSVLLAATTGGLFRTANAGATWSQLRPGVFRDIEFKPGNPNIVFASNNSLVFKSTNGGLSFAGNSGGTGLPASGVGRISLGISPAAPSTIYALLSRTSDNSYLATYKSIDEGATWNLVNDSPNLLGWDPSGNDNGGQAFFTLSICVSPVNANEVYVGGVNIWKSTNGGADFELNAHWYGGGGAPYVHADIHDMEFNPANPSTLLVGCDGGLFKSTDAGMNYTDCSAGLAIKQIYRMGNARTNPGSLIYGSQDNGSDLLYANNFERVLGGDGMDCLIDHTDESVMFAEVYYGDMYKSNDNGAFFYPVSPPDTGAWVTPFAMAANNHDIMYAGYREIWKSTNNGESWFQTTNAINGQGTYVDLSISDVDANVVFAIGSGRVYKTIDGGINWQIVNSGLPGNNYTRILVKSGDPNTAYLTIGGFTASNKVFMTFNGGSTWTNITKTGLPAVPVNCIAYQNNTNNRLYVGTDLGVYYTNDSLNTWLPFNNGLPNTVVTDLEFQYLAGMLRASTYGRGVWQTLVQDSLPVQAVKSKEEPVAMLFPNPAKQMITLVTEHFGGNTIHLKIMDTQGRTIWVSNQPYASHLQIDVSSLAAGVYLLEANNDDKRKITELIIQR